MKSNPLFYLLVITPILFIYFIAKFYGSAAFVIGLITYCFIYRPFIDFYRLKALNEIENEKLWKFFIPLYYYRHVDVLFLWGKK